MCFWHIPYLYVNNHFGGNNLANSEDYLDSLLNSVQTVRKDVTDAQKQTEAILREKQEQRNYPEQLAVP